MLTTKGKSAMANKFVHCAALMFFIVGYTVLDCADQESSRSTASAGFSDQVVSAMAEYDQDCASAFALSQQDLDQAIQNYHARPQQQAGNKKSINDFSLGDVIISAIGFFPQDEQKVFHRYLEQNFEWHIGTVPSEREAFRQEFLRYLGQGLRALGKSDGVIDLSKAESCFRCASFYVQVEGSGIEDLRWPIFTLIGLVNMQPDLSEDNYRLGFTVYRIVEDVLHLNTLKDDELSAQAQKIKHCICWSRALVYTPWASNLEACNRDLGGSLGDSSNAFKLLTCGLCLKNPFFLEWASTRHYEKQAAFELACIIWKHDISPALECLSAQLNHVPDAQEKEELRRERFANMEKARNGIAVFIEKAQNYIAVFNADFGSIVETLTIPDKKILSPEDHCMLYKKANLESQKIWIDELCGVLGYNMRWLAGLDFTSTMPVFQGDTE